MCLDANQSSGHSERMQTRQQTLERRISTDLAIAETAHADIQAAYRYNWETELTFAQRVDTMRAEYRRHRELADRQLAELAAL